MTAPGPGIAERVIAWQRQHGRHGLPWQGTRDPYRVWLSEVMLQQTQVATVIGYYGRFLERFPTVAELGRASLDDVLALWSGLGYYSRARNLHRCAQVVLADHGGAFPRTAAALQGLPGIGRSTAAAIAAICFGERVAILDGNVKRVLGRVLAFADDLADAAAVNRLWQQAEALLPQHGVETYTQGLMDLGATLCSVRQPRCTACPLQADCRALATGEPTRFPLKTRRLQRSRRRATLLWLEHRGRWWLQPRPTTGVWGGLWCLPMLDDERIGPTDPVAPADALATLTARWPGAGQALAPVQHVLTHFDWTLQPVRWRLPARVAASRLATVEQALDVAGAWLEPAQALALGLPAPVRKLLLAAAADPAPAPAGTASAVAPGAATARLSRGRRARGGG